MQKVSLLYKKKQIPKHTYLARKLECVLQNLQTKILKLFLIKLVQKALQHKIFTILIE